MKSQSAPECSSAQVTVQAAFEAINSTDANKQEAIQLRDI